MDETKLFTACFELAEHLMWEHEAPTLEGQGERMRELSEITENFVDISKRNFSLVEDYADGFEVMLGAIKYLHALAIPPLRGNYNWFNYSLHTLLDIAYPQGGPGLEGMFFLKKAKTGVEQLITWANNPEHED